MRDATFGQFAGFLLLWSIGVAVLVDLVWCRPHRVKRIAAESRARRFGDTVARLERQVAVRAQHLPARPLDERDLPPSRYRPAAAPELHVVRERGA